MKFRILKEEDVIGSSRLKIFDSVGTNAKILDCALVNSQNSIDFVESYDRYSYPYLLDKFDKITIPTGPYWRTPQSTIQELIAYYIHSGMINCCKIDSNLFGIRLVVDYDDIKFQILKDEFDNEIVEEINGVKILQALMWPQEFVGEELEANLNLLNKVDYLKKAGTVPLMYRGVLTDFDIYYYEGNKYANIYNKWAKVLPIRWYLDSEKQVLVSESILFTVTPYMAKNSDSLTTFEDTIAYEYINNVFAKYALLSETEILCHSLPFSLYESPNDRQNLMDLKELQKYKKSRKEMRDKLKQAITSLLCSECSYETREDVADLIGQILTLDLKKEANILNDSIYQKI